MKDITGLKLTLNKHKDALEKEFKVKKLGIFGSYVRGEQKRASDIDILIELKEPVGLLRFLELEEYLSKILKKKVDLVTKKALKPYIGQYILREVMYL